MTQTQTSQLEAEELRLLRDRYVPKGVANTAPIFVEQARGATMTDVAGRSYIDFVAGIGTLNVGSSHPEVLQAIHAQVDRFLHTSFHVAMYEGYVRLAQELDRLVPGAFPKKTLLTNSGAEAVENAIKIARKYTGRQAVIALENAFHGRTYMAMSLTSKVNPYKLGFGPFANEVYRVPGAYCYRCAFGLERPSCGLRCVGHMEEVIERDIGAHDVAAIIVEPIQGEGGFIVPPDEYLPAVAELCRRKGILLIVDEVQTGFGRTGKLFAMEHTGVEPDLVTMAKSIGAGLPLGAVVGRAEIMDSVHVGGIGGTFSGNPVACAAALKVIEVMERDGLPERGRKVGEVILQRAREWARRYPAIGDVRGKGAMIALEFVRDPVSREPAADLAGRVITEALERGLLLMKAGSHGNIVRLLVPLVITDEELGSGLDILDAAMAAAMA